MYKDHAVTDQLFQWQTQNSTRTNSKTMVRYRQARTDTPGYRALLFVRSHKSTEQGITSPYTFLGPVQYTRDVDDRPVTVIWQTALPMPSELFRKVKLVG